MQHFSTWRAAEELWDWCHGSGCVGAAPAPHETVM